MSPEQQTLFIGLTAGWCIGWTCGFFYAAWCARSHKAPEPVVPAPHPTADERQGDD